MAFRIIAFFLLFLCTFSSSVRIPFESSEINVNDINHDETNNIFSLDDDAIFLPSQNLPEPNSHPATLIQYEPSQDSQQPTHHDTENKIDSPTTTKTESLEEDSQPLPLTVFRFSPIHRKRPLPLSFRHHRCHHIHRHYKPWNNRHLPRRDVVITEFDRFPADMNEPIMFSRQRNKETEKSEYLKRIYNRYNQRRQEQAENENKDSESTLVKRIRKFLNA